MKTALTLRFVVLFAYSLLASVRMPAQAPAVPIQDFFKSYFEENLTDEPENATGVGRHDYDDRWSDLSKVGRDAHLAHLRSRLADLNKYDFTKLSEQDHLSARLLNYELTSQIESNDISTHLLRVGQLYGFHNRVYLTMDRMPARTLKDYQNILARLHGIPALIDQNLAILDEAIQEGWTQPPIVVDRVNKQIDAQVAQEKKDSALLAPFRNFPSNFTPQEQTKLRAEAEASYDNEFLSAWHKLQKYMKETYAPHARKTDGIGGVAGGKDAYAILVRRLTTTNATPEEIHKTGEAELQRLEAEMFATARETGFNGTLSEFEKKLDALPEQHFRTAIADSLQTHSDSALWRPSNSARPRSRNRHERPGSFTRRQHPRLVQPQHLSTGKAGSLRQTGARPARSRARPRLSRSRRSLHDGIARIS